MVCRGVITTAIKIKRFTFKNQFFTRKRSFAPRESYVVTTFSSMPVYSLKATCGTESLVCTSLDDSGVRDVFHALFWNSSLCKVRVGPRCAVYAAGKMLRYTSRAQLPHLSEIGEGFQIQPNHRSTRITLLSRHDGAYKGSDCHQRSHNQCSGHIFLPIFPSRGWSQPWSPVE